MWFRLTGANAVTDQLQDLRAMLEDHVAAVSRVTAETFHALDQIRSELQPNGGSSLCDAVHSIAAAQRARDERDDVPLFWTDQLGRVTHVNRSFQQLVGKTRDELLGSGWVNAVHVSDRERVLVSWRDAVEEQRDLDDVFQLVDDDGSVAPFHLHAARLLGPSGRLLGYYGVLRELP
jgi:PAS domain S-box-containing protein